MQPLKLSVYIATFSYGGNGGIASEHPAVGRFIARTMLAASRDPRVERVIEKDYCDTPITMVRNGAVVDAHNAGCDLILMIDSDMEPDHLLGADKFARPFWDEAFTKCYEEYTKKPLGVCVFAPYGGQPPNENPFCFVWRKYQNDSPDDHMKLDLMTREEAHALTGFHEQPAAPTGLILYDMRLFELNRPTKKEDKGWFDYEFTDIFKREKGSTEDVFQTRNMVMSCYRLHGYNPLLGAFHCWAGHWKKKCVGRPVLLSYDEVDRKFLEAAFRTSGEHQRKGDVDFTAGLNLSGADLTPHDALPATTVPEADKHLYTSPETPWLHPEFEFCDHFDPIVDVEHLRAIVGRLGPKPMVAEVGCYAGQVSVALASVGATVLCVDHFQGSDYLESVAKAHDVEAAFYRNIERCGVRDRIIVSKSTSLEAVGTVIDKKLDLVFLDAGHDYENVKADIQAWLPKIKPGGVICGHDFNKQLFPGVVQAVAEMFGTAASVAIGTSIWQCRVSPEPNQPERKTKPARKRTSKPSPAKKRSPRSRPSRKHESNGHADVESPGDLVGAAAAE